jgi:hypothetical protein
MRKSFFLKPTIFGSLVVAAGAISLLLSVAFAPSPRGEEPDARIERLRLLNERIDSLEVEQQIKKRSNQSISELDAKTALIRDTITALRLALQKNVRPASASGKSSEQAAGALSLSKLSLSHLSLPTTMRLSGIGLFDRIFIGAGAIAVVFLTFLLFAFFKARVRRGARAAGHPEALTKTKIRTPRSAPDSGEESEAKEGYAPLDATVAKVRERLENEEKALPAAVAPEAPRRSSPTRSMPALKVQPQDPADLSDQVIRADCEGLDIKEISRRYQIGVDQVALILKMAKKQ